MPLAGSGGEPVCLIKDHGVPSSVIRIDCLKDRLIHASQLKRHHPHVVADANGMLANGVCCNPPETAGATEEALKIFLPFSHEVCRTNNEGSAYEAQPLHLSQPETSHDGLTSPRLVREQESQDGLRKHGAVYRTVLVGIRR